VGGIGVKPGVVDGHIAIREYLSLTISLNHDLIDGAPAARFTERLKVHYQHVSPHLKEVI
jgi:pyruvate/2-oxoglutarate dehydrogenase complex dihydrolipoamide acyltransferase (E2) component